MPVQQFIRRLVAACAAPLVALGLAFLGLQIWHERQAWDRHLESELMHTARDIDARLALRLGSLQALAASPSLGSQPDLAAFRRQASLYQTTFDTHVLLVDASRRMLLHTRVAPGEPLPPVPVPAGASAFDAALQGGRPAVGDAFIGPLVGRQLVAMAAPQPQAPGADPGARLLVFAILDADRMRPWLPDLGPARGLVARLRDGQGTAIASRGDLGPEPDAPGRRPWRTVPLQESGWTLTLEGDPHAGWKALGAPAALLGLGWLLASASAWVAGRRFGRTLSAEMSDLVAGTAGGAPPARLEEVAQARRRLNALQSERDTHLRALQASRQELQRLLAEQGRIQERERGRIARELHDDLQQRLALAATQAQALAADARAPTEPVARLTESLREAVAASRRVIADLRPRVLEDLGLGSALQALAAQAEESAGFVCEALVVDDADDAELTPAQALTLYRVAQEALNNARKHAQADTVTLTLGHGPEGGWRLVVEDDGRGFDVGERPALTAFGLIGMRERVQAEGGHWQIHSAPGRGTTLVATLPASGVVVAHL